MVPCCCQQGERIHPTSVVAVALHWCDVVVVVVGCIFIDGITFWNWIWNLKFQSTIESKEWMKDELKNAGPPSSMAVLHHDDDGCRLAWCRFVVLIPMLASSRWRWSSKKKEEEARGSFPPIQNLEDRSRHFFQSVLNLAGEWARPWIPSIFFCFQTGDDNPPHRPAWMQLPRRRDLGGCVANLTRIELHPNCLRSKSRRVF